MPIIHTIHPEEFEYLVERDKELYFAGARNVYFSTHDRGTSGDVFLDQVISRKEKIWTPNIRNPLARKTIFKEVRENIFYLGLFISHPDFKDFSDFYEGLRFGLRRMNLEMNLDDAQAVFGKLFDHYNKREGEK